MLTAIPPPLEQHTPLTGYKSVKDYIQSKPFPTFIIEYPEAYKSLRAVDGKGRNGVDVNFRPIATVIHWEKYANCIFLTNLTDHPHGMVYSTFIGGDSYNRPKIVPYDNPFERTAEQLAMMRDNRDKVEFYTIEDALQLIYGPPEFNNDESRVYTRVTRMALNGCLLLMENGFRSYGSDNPSHSRRLAKFTDNARRKGDVDAELRHQAETRAIPELFGFRQEVNLRRLVGSSDATESTPTGRHVRPHWRRAHWRMQPHGPQLSLRKRILVPHVMVHKDQFRGPASATSYEAV